MRAFVLSAFFLGATFCCVASSEAAFIVEIRAGGLSTSNFSFTGDGTAPSASSASSDAVGLTAGLGSIFGGNGATFDEYTFTYTPGTDVDNFSPSTGTVLGSTDGSPGQGNTSSGLAGGVDGRYRVYFTVPASTNVDVAGSRFTLTQNGSDVVIEPVGQNNGETGPDTQINAPNPDPIFAGGANNAWALLGTVDLVADGTTYNISQRSLGVGPFPPAPSFVSQRALAVMWERVEIPEPTSLALLGLGAAGLAFVRRKSC